MLLWNHHMRLQENCACYLLPVSDRNGIDETAPFFCKIYDKTHLLCAIRKYSITLPFPQMYYVTYKLLVIKYVETVYHAKEVTSLTPCLLDKKCYEVAVEHMPLPTITGKEVNEITPERHNTTHPLLIIQKNMLSLPSQKCAKSLTACERNDETISHENMKWCLPTIGDMEQCVRLTNMQYDSLSFSEEKIWCDFLSLKDLISLTSFWSWKNLLQDHLSQKTHNFTHNLLVVGAVVMRLHFEKKSVMSLTSCWSWKRLT